MLEGLALFLPTLWISAVYASPSAAAAAGALWTLGRILYANGYYKETKARFKLCFPVLLTPRQAPLPFVSCAR